MVCRFIWRLNVRCGFWILFWWPVDLRNKYGAPISRKRLYPIMIRKDVLTDEVKNNNFGDFVKKKLDHMKVECKIGWFLIWKNVSCLDLHTSISIWGPDIPNSLCVQGMIYYFQLITQQFSKTGRGNGKEQGEGILATGANVEKQEFSAIVFCQTSVNCFEVAI